MSELLRDGGKSSPPWERDYGLVLAADVSSLEELKRTVEVCAEFPEVVAIKIGCTLALRYGLPAAVSTIKQMSTFHILYDHQKAATDIPQMGQSFMEACRDSGVQTVILFPQAGPRTLEGFVSAAFKSGLKPTVGLVMTHPGYLASDGGFILDEAPERIASAAIRMGVDSFVLPGTRPDVIKHYSTGVLATIPRASIMMPGIGSQGGDLVAACTAAKPHGRFPIVGSAIYKAANPKEAVRQFAKLLT